MQYWQAVIHTSRKHDVLLGYTRDINAVTEDSLKKLWAVVILGLSGVLTALWVELFVLMPSRSIEKKIAKEKETSEGQRQVIVPTENKNEPRLK